MNQLTLSHYLITVFSLFCRLVWKFKITGRRTIRLFSVIEDTVVESMHDKDQITLEGKRKKCFYRTVLDFDKEVYRFYIDSVFYWGFLLGPFFC